MSRLAARGRFAQTGKREIKGSALIFLRFCPDSAAVLAHDAVDGGQADAGAFEFLGTVKALENAKKLVGIFHIKSDPIIADE